MPAIFTAGPLQLYLTVRLKPVPLARKVTTSPAKTSDGSTEQDALGGTGAGPPPHMKLRPDCSRTPRISVAEVEAEGPYR